MKTSLKRAFFAAAVCLCLHTAAAQEGFSKDGTLLYNLGIGYERMADAFSSKGFALGLSARFYASERAFGEIMGHWGTHEGEKEVMQKGEPFGISDERNCLLLTAGAGYDVFQSAEKKFCVYVKGLVGYGSRAEKYKDYQPLSADDGLISPQNEKSKSGIAAVVGIGFDWRYGVWTLSPSVNAIYVGGKTDMAYMVAMGWFY